MILVVCKDNGHGSAMPLQRLPFISFPNLSRFF